MKRTVTYKVFMLLSLALFALALAGCGAEEDIDSSSGASGSGSQTSSPDDDSTSGGTNTGSKYVTLSWLEPTTNSDGSCLDDLGNYVINYGLSPNNYTNQVSVDANNLVCVDSNRDSSCGYHPRCSFMVDDLETGSYYFAMQAVDNNGNVSSYSNEVIYTVQ